MSTSKDTPEDSSSPTVDTQPPAVQSTYSATDKTRIIALLDVLGLTASDTAEFAVLRQVRGRLVTRHPNGVDAVVAEGRGDWVGWVELTTQPITEAAVANTARVIADVNADVLGVVEAEDRVVLKRFADAQLRHDDTVTYPHVMLIDGNDNRGIDVAILTKRGWPLETIRSHVDDTDDHGAIFSRDCPEYEIDTPGGHRLVVLVKHPSRKGSASRSTTTPAVSDKHSGWLTSTVT